MRYDADPGGRATTADERETRSTGERAAPLLVPVAVFLAYGGIAVLMTWPLATAPARLGIPNMDVFGNTWAMSWVVHQAAADPRHLFDSNMFFPHTLSLAYAESLLPQALLAAPVIALGGSALLAYNVVFLLTFAATGLGAYLLAKDASGSGSGAFLAGIGFAFCAYRWDHIVHLQSLTVQWLPLTLLCCRRLWRGGSAGATVGLAVFATLQVLSSGYYALLTAFALAITLWGEWRQGGAPRRPLRILAAFAVSGLLVLPVFAVYRSVQQRHGFSRGRAEAVAWSARPQSYFEPGRFVALPHLEWLHARARDREPLYPGGCILLLAGVGVLWGRRHPETAWAGALALGGFLLSLGPEIRLSGFTLPGPFLVLRWLPGGALLRTPSRLGVLALLGLGVLAALGWARLVKDRRHLALFTAAAAALLTTEAWPIGLDGAVRPFPKPPPSAGWLATAPPGATLELPWNDPADSALYLYWSTAHWQRMVNGFGSFDAPGNFGLGLLGNRWSSPYSAAQFRKAGVRYVVVHMDRVRRAHRDRILGAPSLPEGVRLAADLGVDRVYVIEAIAPTAR